MNIGEDEFKVPFHDLIVSLKNQYEKLTQEEVQKIMACGLKKILEGKSKNKYSYYSEIYGATGRYDDEKKLPFVEDIKYLNRKYKMSREQYYMDKSNKDKFNQYCNILMKGIEAQEHMEPSLKKVFIKQIKGHKKNIEENFIEMSGKYELKNTNKQVKKGEAKVNINIVMLSEEVLELMDSMNTNVSLEDWEKVEYNNEYNRYIPVRKSTTVILEGRETDEGSLDIGFRILEDPVNKIVHCIIVDMEDDMKPKLSEFDCIEKALSYIFDYINSGDYIFDNISRSYQNTFKSLEGEEIKEIYYYETTDSFAMKIKLLSQ